MKLYEQKKKGTKQGGQRVIKKLNQKGEKSIKRLVKKVKMAGKKL
jgi:hypothetical protein